MELEEPQSRARRRVLLLAYACSPYRGSEPETGWRRANALARNFDTWVLCVDFSEFRENIERFQREHGANPNLHFCFVPGLSFDIPLLNRLRPLGYLAYNRWHRRAYTKARELHRELQFDVVHQANLCGYREPGYLWRLGVPFIWGPVGGTQNYPFRFLTRAGLQGAAIEGTRNILNLIQLRFSPRVRKAARTAAVVLTANPVGERDFKHFYGITPTPMLDVGVVRVSDRPRTHDDEKRPLRLLWSGVFEHRKALHLLLMALAKVPAGVDYELRILGRGPLDKRWRKLARRLDLGSRCRFMGHLPHARALELNEWADVFVFTSLRDTFGTVVLESLSRGLPVICLDHQGAGAVVTNECGIKLPVTNPDEVTQRLADTIVSLASDRKQLEPLSRQALVQAERYLWEYCGEEMLRIYEEILAQRAPRIATTTPAIP